MRALSAALSLLVATLLNGCQAIPLADQAANSQLTRLTPTPARSCQTADGKTVSDILRQYAAQWNDANKLASSSSRITLTAPVSELQRIRRDALSQTWPDCATEAKALLIGSMDATIEGYLGFMADKPNYQGDFDRADRLMKSFLEELLYVSGVPRPTPTPIPPPTPIPSPTTPPTLTPIPPTPTPRTLGYADASLEQPILLAIKEDTWRRLATKYYQDNDTESVNQQIKVGLQAGEFVPLLDPLQVVVLEFDSVLTKVQIMTGPEQGRIGWLLTSQVERVGIGTPLPTLAPTATPEPPTPTPLPLKWIPGITADDIVRRGKARGLTCSQNQLFWQWYCTSPPSADIATPLYSLTADGDASDRLKTVNASFGQSTKTPNRAAEADFLSGMATLNYDGAEPERASQWVREQLSSLPPGALGGNTPEVSINGVTFRILNLGNSKALEIRASGVPSI